QSKLDLQIKRGELCCLIGPNGVGKSTLLKTLSKQLQILEGQVIIAHNSISDYSNEQLAQKLSIVLTESIQVPNLKVSELVAMGRFPYTNFWGKLTEKDQEVVDQALRAIGLQDLADRKLIELSDGEKQKSSIAKALAQDTSLILLDEPTAFLDFPSKMAILSELRKIAHTNNVAIILSTHDLELALKMADLIWLFPKKNQYITGIPEDLVLSGAIAKAFSNETIVFDLKTAHFVQKTKNKDLVNIEGDSLEALWLKRTLIRKGINPMPNKQNKIKVAFDTDEKKFKLYLKSEFIGTFDTIQETMLEIEKHT
ncbi:MAG: ABC transporter ATP-binding protein, partial [Bacteroidales bacterium]|nr:ABC transporter ATP-binding protein [Bacteroidales bacterium]